MDRPPVHELSAVNGHSLRFKYRATAAPDHASHIVSAWTPDLASVPEEAWQKAVKRFKILKPLLDMGNSERTFAHIKKAARALGKHPATVYRWIENYGRSERLSVFLRKERSDRGVRRLSNKVEKIIDAAIKKIYLTAERPDVAANAADPFDTPGQMV